MRPSRSRHPRDWLVPCVLALGIAGLRLRTLELAANPECPVPLQPPSWKVDLRHADRELLRVLPGVGPALADRIVQEREVNGPFVDASDLGRVPGIGPVLLERIRPFVR